MGEELTVAQEAMYPMWRFHLWHLNYGSYEAIERQVKNNILTPFICPKADCDCHWPKSKEQSQ